MYDSQVVAILLILSAALYLLRKPRSRQGDKPYPPGPKGKPILGNALDIPPTHSWLYYASLKKDFGDLVYVNALGQPLIILNSFDACNDLLYQRASIYSDRPRLIMLGEMMNWERILGFMPYGQRWREHRKLVHNYMSKKAIGDYIPSIEAEVKLFLARLVKHPEAFMPEFRLTSTRLLLRNTYGIEVNSTQDKRVLIAEEAMNQGMAAGTPGKYLVEMIPALRHVPEWVPGARNFQEVARSGREIGHRMVSVPFEEVKRDMALDTAVPSFTSHLLQGMSEGTVGETVDETSAMWLSGSMYAAGTDTTVTTIQIFFLAMILFPEAQRKAQEEIDAYIGTERRIPGWEDKANLPYIESFLKELYRWHIPVPLAIPHKVTDDNEYRGYLIPKGAIVVPNSWAISQDETNYPEPEKFLPERFMSENGTHNPEGPLDPRLFAFGYGRRICAGIHFAEAVVYSTVVSLLATVNISNAIDKEGKAIIPSREFTGSMTSHAPPFECKIQPRSNDKLALINELAAEAALMSG